MVVKSIVALSRGKKRITFDEGLAIALYPKEIKAYGLEEGAEIESGLIDEMFDEILLKRAKARSLHLLEQYDRTESDLRLKLKQGEYPPSVIDEVIKWLYSYHYLDDQRYAENLVLIRMGRESKAKLKMTLIKKGVPNDIAEDTLEKCYSSDEEDLINRLITKKRFDPNTADDKERRRMYNLLLRNGFSSSSAIKAISREGFCEEKVPSDAGKSFS